jgi:hypothetical protein
MTSEPNSDALATHVLGYVGQFLLLTIKFGFVNSFDFSKVVKSW